MSTEQRVRTMCGWVGVEISKSRVRTPGRAGYGLYRVRGSFPVKWSISRDSDEIDRSPGQYEPTLWTAYAFELDVIEAQVGNAIGSGTPEKPADLHLPKSRVQGGELPYATVPTRWTQAYRGRRDLGTRGAARLCGRPQRHEDECMCLADGKARWLPDGPEVREPVHPFVRDGKAEWCKASLRTGGQCAGMPDDPIHAVSSEPVAVRPEYAAELTALAALVDEGLVVMVHDPDMCSCSGTAKLTARCVGLTIGRGQVRETVRDRQRAANAEFQQARMPARRAGKAAYQKRKLSLKKRQGPAPI